MLLQSTLTAAGSGPLPGAAGQRRAVPGKRRVLTCAAGEPRSHQYVTELPLPTPPPPPAQRPVCFTLVPVALVSLVGVRLVLRRLQQGSMQSLERRGLADSGEEAGRQSFYADAMKDYKTVELEQLSDTQIAAARKRRLREREAYNLESVDVPDNHPFAERASQDVEQQEELLKARLSVRRGLPLQNSSAGGVPGR